jgi:hypothetical protein
VFSGRAGLDEVCVAAKDALSLAGGAPHALISVSSSDAIANFPALYGLPVDRPFASRFGLVIADDFADLLDGTLDRSLGQAGVIPEPDMWLTGSNSDGTASANTCQGWTYFGNDSVIRADYGYAADTDYDWITADGTATCLALQYHVLCVTW